MSKMVDEFWRMMDEAAAREAAERARIDSVFPLPQPKILHLEKLPKHPAAQPGAHFN